jgi:hypothetical protein
MTALSNDPLFPPRFGIFLKLEFPQERPYGPPPFGPPVASETDPRASVPAARAASPESPEAGPRVPSPEASPSASPRAPSPEASPRAPSPEASIAPSPEAEIFREDDPRSEEQRAPAVHESAPAVPAVPESAERVERAESLLAADTTSDFRAAATPSIAPSTAANSAASAAQHVSVPNSATTEQPVPAPKAPVPNSAISAQQKLEIMSLSFGDLLRRKGAW